MKIVGLTFRPLYKGTKRTPKREGGGRGNNGHNSGGGGTRAAAGARIGQPIIFPCLLQQARKTMGCHFISSSHKGTKRTPKGGVASNSGHNLEGGVGRARCCWSSNRGSPSFFLPVAAGTKNYGLPFRPLQPQGHKTHPQKGGLEVTAVTS